MSARRIFLSHSHSDIDLFTAMVARLKEFDGRFEPVWIGPYSDSAGKEWWGELTECLSSCHLFIAILTPASIQSRFVMFEFGYWLGLSRESERPRPILAFSGLARGRPPEPYSFFTGYDLEDEFGRREYLKSLLGHVRQPFDSIEKARAFPASSNLPSGPPSQASMAEVASQILEQMDFTLSQVKDAWDISAKGWRWQDVRHGALEVLRHLERDLFAYEYLSGERSLDHRMQRLEEEAMVLGERLPRSEKEWRREYQQISEKLRQLVSYWDLVYDSAEMIHRSENNVRLDRTAK